MIAALPAANPITGIWLLKADVSDGLSVNGNNLPGM